MTTRTNPMKFFTRNTVGAALALVAATSTTAFAAAPVKPGATKCPAGTIGGIVKEVKVAGGKTVMSFQGTKFQITIPNSQPAAKELAKVKPGTLHCEVEDEDI